MKAKITIAVTVLLLGTITTANADLYIQSPIGLTQAQWNSSDAYRNFSCPAGHGRGEGVDMNFTTTRADDYWFVSCTPIVVVTPTPIPTPIVTPTPTPTQTETSTATVVSTVTAPTNNTPSNVVTDTRTATTETTTATTVKSNTIDSLYAQIMALFTQLLALIANLNR
jgi:hypothetical protein